MNKLTKLLALVTLSLGLSLNASPHNIDPAHTDIGFSVKHLMITNVKGEFREFSGDLDFDHKTKNINVFNGIIKASSIDTGIEKRDNHLRSKDFLLVEQYPELTFTMTSYKASDDEGEMIGDLTIRGVTKLVKFEVEDLATVKDLKGENRVGFALRAKIKRSDFGLAWNKALEFGGVAVSDTVKINIEIEAVEK